MSICKQDMVEIEVLTRKNKALSEYGFLLRLLIFLAILHFLC